jgi:hypothetical protein
MSKRGFIAVLFGALSTFLCAGAGAQEGLYGIGHDKWHRDFYAKLRRNDGQGPCCSQTDCRPTQSRKVGGIYEVRLDGAWTLVPESVINRETAPDGGTHVCAPQQTGHSKGLIWCVILPPDS